MEKRIHQQKYMNDQFTSNGGCIVITDDGIVNDKYTPIKLKIASTYKLCGERCTYCGLLSEFNLCSVEDIKN